MAERIRIRTSRDLENAPRYTIRDLENAPRYDNGYDLSRANLEGASLWYANLRYAILTDADLTNANLTGASLRRADLTNANLTGAKLPIAVLEYANLTNANLEGVDLTDTNLRDAILIGANLEGVDLTRVNLTRANLQFVNLKGANLEGLDLTNANLGGANLEGAKFRGANLTRANLTGVLSANLTGANLTDAIGLPPSLPLPPPPPPSLPRPLPPPPPAPAPAPVPMSPELQEVMNNITVYDIRDIEHKPATQFFQDHDEDHPYIIRNSIGLYTGAALGWRPPSSSGNEFVECADNTVTEWDGVNSYRNYIKRNARRFIKIIVDGSPTMVIKPDWYDSRQIPGTKFFQLVDTNKPVFKFMISVLASGNIPSDFEAVGSDHCNQTSPIGTYTLEPITIEQLQQYTSVVEPPLAPPLAPRPQPTGLFSRARARMSRMFNPNPSGGKNRKMRNTTRKTHKKLKTKKSKMLNKKRRLKTRKMK